MTHFTVLVFKKAVMNYKSHEKTYHFKLLLVGSTTKVRFNYRMSSIIHSTDDEPQREHVA